AAPILALHGTQDTYVAYEQSVWLLQRLLDAGVTAELETLSGAGHGFKGADAEKAEARSIAWLDRWLAKP
ncbi:MAG: prolyl oligopeptidase family serine peptidase, partial [Bryobacteraceae bacterium]|nr:prolyl oligopeptidase family serine peptidase [Bryobacteraceae bacterium]